MHYPIFQTQETSTRAGLLTSGCGPRSALPAISRRTCMAFPFMPTCSPCSPTTLCGARRWRLQRYPSTLRWQLSTSLSRNSPAFCWLHARTAPQVWARCSWAFAVVEVVVVVLSLFVFQCGRTRSDRQAPYWCPRRSQSLPLPCLALPAGTATQAMQVTPQLSCCQARPRQRPPPLSQSPRTHKRRLVL